MDPASVAAVGEEAFVGLGAIGGIRPDIAGRIRRIDQPIAQPGTVVGGSVGDLLPADKAVPFVDPNVGLVAEGGDREVTLDGAISACLCSS